MNRNLTNAIRFILDECIPPIIRDSKLFMYPLFYIWFKGKNIEKVMNLNRSSMAGLMKSLRGSTKNWILWQETA